MHAESRQSLETSSGAILGESSSMPLLHELRQIAEPDDNRCNYIFGGDGVDYFVSRSNIHHSQVAARCPCSVYLGCSNTASSIAYTDLPQPNQPPR